MQILLLRKVSLQVLLQGNFSLVFGWVTDVYDALLLFHTLTPPEVFSLLFTAFIFTSWGVFLTVQCNFVVTPVGSETIGKAPDSDLPFSYNTLYAEKEVLIVHARNVRKRTVVCRDVLSECF